MKSVARDTGAVLLVVTFVALMTTYGTTRTVGAQDLSAKDGNSESFNSPGGKTLTFVEYARNGKTNIICGFDSADQVKTCFLAK